MAQRNPKETVGALFSFLVVFIVMIFISDTENGILGIVFASLIVTPILLLALTFLAWALKNLLEILVDVVTALKPDAHSEDKKA